MIKTINITFCLNLHIFKAKIPRPRVTTAMPTSRVSCVSLIFMNALCSNISLI